jgi:RNA ligase
VKLSKILDEQELARLVEQRYISERRHPALPLRILNYTPKTQYERHWTAETELCRGLIVHDDGTIVGRSFRKFFNLGEHQQELPAEPFVAYQKLDGCLGIPYIDADGQPSLATRGSFTSFQAQRGTDVLRRRYPNALPWLVAHPPMTLSFEIILPEYRIVVDYQGREDVVLLAGFDVETGQEIDVRGESFASMFPLAKTWAAASVAEALDLVESPVFDGEEGVVVRFESGLRLKLKRSEYVYLHRIVTGLTPRRIWEMLKDGTPPIDRLFAGTPAGFQAWAREQIDAIQGRRDAIVAACQQEYARIVATAPPDRKAFALAAASYPHAAILFRLYDQKSYDEIAWKLVKPGPDDPYRLEV